MISGMIPSYLSAGIFDVTCREKKDAGIIYEDIRGELLCSTPTMFIVLSKRADLITLSLKQ